MENKKLYIGLGVLAVAGIAVYLYRKNKAEEASEKKEKFSGASGTSIKRNRLASTASSSPSFRQVETCDWKECECSTGKLKCYSKSAKGDITFQYVGSCECQAPDTQISSASGAVLSKAGKCEAGMRRASNGKCYPVGV
jgi:hypothetical protein